MDKDLLRLVIIGAGAIVFLLVLFTGLWQGRSRKRVTAYYGNKNPLDKIDSSLAVNLSEDEFDIVPLGSAPDRRFDDHENVEFERNQVHQPEPSHRDKAGLEPETMFGNLDSFQETPTTPAEPETQYSPEPEPELNVTTSTPTEPFFQNSVSEQTREQMPDVIQFSLIANSDTGFNGADIANLLTNAGLVYGDIQIFERLDAQKQVDYGVASMVNPGTFPQHDQHLFHCPGITFFMQPKVLEEPIVVFNEMISLIFLLARQLHGDILDGHRQPLAEHSIDEIRAQLTD